MRKTDDKKNKNSSLNMLRLFGLLFLPTKLLSLYFNKWTDENKPFLFARVYAQFLCAIVGTE